MSLLKISGLSKKYEDKCVLSNVNINLNNNRVYGLLGPNGAGKTTLFRCISGLSYIDEGNISININEDEKDVIYVFEQPNLYESLTASEHLKFVASVNKLKINEDALLKKYMVYEYADKPIKDCSLGMKKRIQLMCAMVLEPKVLLLDEYISGLDPKGILLVSALIKDYAKEGHLVIVSTHILSLADKLCDSLIFIKDGEIINETDDFEDIMENYKDIEEYYFSIINAGEK